MVWYLSMLIFILAGNAAAALAAPTWDLGCHGHDGLGSTASHLLQRTSRMLRSASARDAILQGNEIWGCGSLQIPEVPPLVAAPLRNITWLHFPKAGTSFLATIWNYACSRRMALDLAVSPRAVPGCEQCYDVALMDRYPPDDYCEEGFLSQNFSTQHRPVTSSAVQSDELKVIGMFRRPSQRLISAFHDSCHASGLAEDQYKVLMQECGPNGKNSAGCYARFPGIAGCMSRMLTGGFCAETQFAESSFDGGKAHLEEAIAMVKEMAFVGLTEYWDLSICLFQRMFGGTVNAAQLVDFHEGDSHQDQLYDETQLMGFVDEVDEAIYQAASDRFHELVQTYVSPDFSECATLVQSANRLTEMASKESKNSCSCDVAGRECGFSSSLGMSCGQCPTKRLKFSSEDANVDDLNVTCDEEHGNCLVEGGLRPDVFKWNM